MLTVVVMIIALLVHSDHVFELEVPVLYLGNTIAPLIAFIFSVCILLGIYSTTAPMYWLVKNEFMKIFPAKLSVPVTVVLGVIFIICGTLPFGELVSIIYPFVGYIGAIVVVIIFARTLYNNFSNKHSTWMIEIKTQ